MQFRQAERVQAMQENKGRWLKWPSSASAGTVKKILEGFDGTFEVVSRKLEDRYQCFARCTAAALNPGPPMHTCPTCDEPLVPETAEKGELTAAIAGHYRANPECKQAAVRRSRGR